MKRRWRTKMSKPVNNRPRQQPPSIERPTDDERARKAESNQHTNRTEAPHTQDSPSTEMLRDGVEQPRRQDTTISVGARTRLPSTVRELGSEGTARTPQTTASSRVEESVPPLEESLRSPSPMEKLEGDHKGGGSSSSILEQRLEAFPRSRRAPSEDGDRSTSVRRTVELTQKRLEELTRRQSFSEVKSAGKEKEGIRSAII